MGEKAEEHNLYSGAFLIGFFSAPILTTVVGWTLSFLVVVFEFDPGPLGTPILAASFAGWFGAPSYILFGLPVLWYCSVRKRPAPMYLLKAAVFANVVSAPLVLLFVRFLTGDAYFDFALLIVFGTIFAAIWGAWIGFIYGPLTRAADRLKARASDHREQHPG